MAIEDRAGFYHLEMTTENTKRTKIGSDSVFTEVVAQVGSIVNDDGIIKAVDATISYMYDDIHHGCVEDTWENVKVKGPDDFDSDALDEMCLMVRKMMEALSAITSADGILLKVELDILYTKDETTFSVEYDTGEIRRQMEDDDEDEEDDD